MTDQAQITSILLMELGHTLREAVIYFKDYDNCRKFMVELRWPSGVVRCPRCNSDHVIYLEKARVWKCYSKHDSPKFSLKTGTVFEDSPLGLDKWLPAVWMIVNDKNGISSWELHRAIGVTQKTAWFMLHRIRLRCRIRTASLAEKSKLTRLSSAASRATCTRTNEQRRFTALAEPIRLSSSVWLSATGRSALYTLIIAAEKELQEAIRENVEAGSAIFSDELRSYEGLSERLRSRRHQPCGRIRQRQRTYQYYRKLLEPLETRTARHLACTPKTQPILR